jgi:hypothetical protein
VSVSAGRRAPLLLTVALIGIGAAGPAAADREPPSRGTTSAASTLAEVSVRVPALPEVSVRVPALPKVKVSVRVHVLPKVSVRPPTPPRHVPTDGSVPGVSVWRSPVPGVSIAGRPGKRPVPKVTVPGMTIYEDAVCGQRVQVGRCPQRIPRQAPRHSAPARKAARAPATPALTPPPSPIVTPRLQARKPEPPARRRNPLGTVLVMVVLVTAITSTTAVAFGARR